jgi:hypothetical protein
VCAIGGVSGTGKSYLVEALVKAFPDTFFIMQQYTTRDKRNDQDNGYVFIDDAKYAEIKPNLIARTTFNGKHYGTEWIPQEGKIGLVIANTEGMLDFLTHELRGVEGGVGKVFALGLDRSDFDTVLAADDGGRQSRAHLMEGERKVIQLCDLVHSCNNDAFLDVNDAYNLIVDFIKDEAIVMRGVEIKVKDSTVTMSGHKLI